MNSQEKQVLIFESRSAMEDFVVRQWAEISALNIGKNGAFLVALSGGKTPAPLYERIAEEKGLDWDRILIFQVDERFVPEDDPDSNFRMIRRTLVDRVPIPNGNVFPIPVNAPDPFVAAIQYETIIRQRLTLPKGRFPRFDLVLLGIGKDGHTASLFPGDGLLFEKSRIAASAFPETGPARVTLTLPAINRARHVFFYVTGIEKSAAFRKAVSGDPALPASLVRPLSGELLFLADLQAGALLQ